jgi:glucose/arabinose dehydrogenase
MDGGGGLTGGSAGGADGGAGGMDSGGGAAGGPDSGDATIPREAGPVDCSSAPSLSNLRLQNVVASDELDGLVFAAQPPGSSDWYLVRQGGQIHLFTGGALRSEPILDLNPEMGDFRDGGDERGLLGLAFPPDFAQSKLFYVMATPADGPEQGAELTDHDLIREYRRTDSGATLVRTLLDLGQSARVHNGGTLHFGPDGKLYIGTGDGGEGCGDTQGVMGASQSMSSNFGKILRIDPKASNPMPEVAHYGLRNPYRFSFDRDTGDMYIGDVGADRFEEVDFAPAGSAPLNFGWPAFEANRTDGCRPLRPGSTHTPPIFEVGRRNNGCQGQLCEWASVVGGVVYRGRAIPALYGTYITADYMEPYLAGFKYCHPTRSPTATLHRDMLGVGSIAAFVEDNAGELYLIADRRGLSKVVAR